MSWTFLKDKVPLLFFRPVNLLQKCQFDPTPVSPRTTLQLLLLRITRRHFEITWLEDNITCIPRIYRRVCHPRASIYQDFHPRVSEWTTECFLSTCSLEWAWSPPGILGKMPRNLRKGLSNGMRLIAQPNCNLVTISLQSLIFRGRVGRWNKAHWTRAATSPSSRGALDVFLLLILLQDSSITDLSNTRILIFTRIFTFILTSSNNTFKTYKPLVFRLSTKLIYNIQDLLHGGTIRLYGNTLNSCIFTAIMRVAFSLKN